MTKTKFKPVLFRTPMVQAILEDRKTQTRRVNNHPYFSKEELLEHTLPKYQVGDVLWVRETFELVPVQVASIREADLITKMKFKYKADGEECFERWKPSIHMPREAARIFLKVTNVRLERLQDISESDAIAEGVELYDTNLYKDYSNFKLSGVSRAKVSFATLWDKINGQEETKNWLADPFVWVYEFERVEKPKDF